MATSTSSNNTKVNQPPSPASILQKKRRGKKKSIFSGVSLTMWVLSACAFAVFFSGGWFLAEYRSRHRAGQGDNDAAVGTAESVANDAGTSLVSSLDLADPQFVLSGYLPNYRSYINVNQTANFLTDLILFSIDPTPAVGGSMLDMCCLEDHHYAQGREARAFKTEQQQKQRMLQHGEDGNEGAKEEDAKPLKLWAAVGGAGRSEGFTPLFREVERRDVFLARIKGLAERHELDGIDFDFQQFQQADFINYLNFIHRAAIVLHEAGLLISVTLHRNQGLPIPTYGVLDRVNLMAYGMEGVHHASLDLVKSSIQQLVQSGCPPGKIVLGVPAYGRHSKKQSFVLTFAELWDYAVSSKDPGVEGLGKVIDERHEWMGYRFDSPRELRRKVEYAQMAGLKGVFVWEIGQDKQHPDAPGGILLEALAGRVYGGELPSGKVKDEL